MNANEITFGCEIECYVPTGTIVAGSYHRGVQIPALPAGWNAQTDGSLYTRRRGYIAVEIVSPVLKGLDGLNQVKAAVSYLNGLGAKVNDHCGFHVHVGVGNDRDLLQKVIHLAANYEQAIYATTGTRNRETGSYCRPISRDFQSLRFDQPGLGSSLAFDRYHVVNVENIVSNKKPTVEFRAFAGTLNLSKIVAYLRLCIGIVEKASKMKRVPKWTGKRDVAATSPLHRSGTGQTQLVRVFYGLGWIKGDRNPVFGGLTADGLPSIDNSKKTLMKLARKYDGPR
jgi:hypothetical protein